MEHVETATFRNESLSWLLGGYSCEIRYLAHKVADRNVLFAASVTFCWRPNSEHPEFHKNASTLVAGVKRLDKLSIDELHKILDSALSGTIQLGDTVLSLQTGGILECRRPPRQIGVIPERPMESHQCKMFSAMNGFEVAEPWYQVFTPASDIEIGREKPYFDGFDHLLHSLGLPDPRLGNVNAHIEIIIEPPAIFDMERCQWKGDSLEVAILAHGTIGWNAVSLMGHDGLKITRGPMTPFGKIEWVASGEGKQSAWSCTSFPHAKDATAVLKVGGLVAGRCSFPHPTRAGNVRYLAMEKCDDKLTKLEGFLFSPAKQARLFEAAVAALLFLRGFNPALSMDTNSADIVVMTRFGRLLVVECSTSLDEAPGKARKLLRRREAIREALEESDQLPEIVACLVCVLPTKQIAKPGDSLRHEKIRLWSKEDLEREWSQIRHQGDADKMLTEMAKSLSDAAHLNLPSQSSADPSVVEL
jgi:hypothetical protein